MELQIANSSVWETVFFVLMMVVTLLGGLVFAAATAALGNPKYKDKIKDKAVYATGAVMVVGILGAAFGGFMSGEQAVNQNHATFSQQLMDEYHVKMDRSPGDVLQDLSRSDVSDVVFTRDGKVTPVLIRRVDSRDDAYKMTLEFIDLGDKSLYPKP